MKTITYIIFAALLVLGNTHAQQWPAKTVRWIIPWPPGGGADVLARILQPSLSEALGQQVVVDNRGGAAGNIGAELAAKSPPDGYTIVFAYSGTHSINPHIYRKMPFKESDFAPLIWTASVPQVVVVHPSLPVKAPRDIVALAKSKPDQFTYGSSGNGAINHLAGAFFASITGAPIVHVPYKGGGPAAIALMGGEIAMILGAPGNPTDPLEEKCLLETLPSNIKLVAKQGTAWSRDAYQQATSAILAEHPDIDGIVGPYGDAFVGAIRAFEAADADGSAYNQEEQAP